MHYILGIDAGATKTHFMLADENGNCVAESFVGPANMHNQTEKEITSVLLEGFEGVSVEHKVKQLDSLCYAGAGVNTENMKIKAKEIVKNTLPVKSSKNILVVNDIEAVLPTCSDKSYGVSVIVGTGSNFYGINKDGKKARAGGLDYLLSDEGSSWWVGRECLVAVVQSEDGRGKKTILKDMVLDEFEIENARQLADIVYEEDFGKKEIASLAKLVDEAYKSEDEVAEKILKRAAEEISRGINAVIKNIFPEEAEEIDVVAVGGMFNSPFPLKQEIKDNISKKNINFMVCDKPPVCGAVKLAKRLL